MPIAIQRAPDRTSILQSIVVQFGIRRGVYSPENAEQFARGRMDLLIPYIDDLPELDLVNLWEGCNDLGHVDWRKHHVDERISKLSRSCLAFLTLPLICRQAWVNCAPRMTSGWGGLRAIVKR